MLTANELAFHNWQDGLDWHYSNSIDTKTVIQLTLFCEELKQEEK